ncbi:MAG TPA: DMT family transporter [Bacillota bacterium]|nr:DMT family transporter [Bacillota bacterium]HPZ84938.1 DMT family transporter [Bacillota bacterium]
MPQIVADLMLLLATAIWGSTFPIVKTAISSIKPFTFLAARFLVAGATLLLVLPVRRLVRLKRSRGAGHQAGHDHEGVRLPRGLIKSALIAGSILLFAYSAQTFGMLTVPAGKAGFIVGMSVVMVPVGSALVFKVAPATSTSVGVALATVGLGLMSLTLPFKIEIGDTLVFLSAIGYAVHILLLGEYSKHYEPVALATVQVLIVGVGCLVAALLFEQPLFIPRESWGAMAYIGVLATALTMTIQSTVQRYTSATHTALILSGEPVFAALFAWLLIGETLTPRETLGAALILAGMLVSELAPGKKQPAARERMAVSD